MPLGGDSATPHRSRGCAFQQSLSIFYAYSAQWVVEECAVQWIHPDVLRNVHEVSVWVHSEAWSGLAPILPGMALRHYLKAAFRISGLAPIFQAAFRINGLAPISYSGFPHFITAFLKLQRLSANSPQSVLASCRQLFMMSGQLRYSRGCPRRWSICQAQRLYTGFLHSLGVGLAPMTSSSFPLSAAALRKLQRLPTVLSGFPHFCSIGA